MLSFGSRFQIYARHCLILTYPVLRYRQVCYALVILQGDGIRTGCWQQMTVAEFGSRKELDDDIVVTHKGGKTIKITTLAMSREAASATSFYIACLRPLLPSSKTSDRVFCGLTPSDYEEEELKAFGLNKKDLCSMLSGTRRFNVSLSLQQGEAGVLSAEQVRQAAFYRRHSVRVAETTYDQRNIVDKDIQIRRVLRASLQALLGTDEQREQQTAQPDDGMSPSPP